jgi:alpha-1,6-mannosyltransferase
VRVNQELSSRLAATSSPIVTKFGIDHAEQAVSATTGETRDEGRATPTALGRWSAAMSRVTDAFLGSSAPAPAVVTADAAGSVMAASASPITQSRAGAPSTSATAVAPGADAVARSAAALGALPAERRWTAHALTTLYALAGFAGVLVVVGSAPVWRNAAPTWRLTVPGIAHPPDSSFAAAVLFLVGLVLMWIGWAGMVGRSERLPGTPRTRLVVVIAVLVLWCVPPLLGTPMLSNDAYSYAAQGEMATRGIDPTAVGPYALHRGEFLNAVDPIWRDAPAPYGPVAIQLSAWAAAATGHLAAPTVWLMRVIAALGVAMTAFGVVLIARRQRVPTASALVAGVGGPLVLLHMVGGSHNDSLMMGLMVLGMAAFTANRRVMSVVVVTLAVAVKLPAAAALAFIGWNWTADRNAPLRTRVAGTALVGAGAGAILLVLSAAVGMGFGWITALSSTGSITSTFSVSTKLGLVANDLAGLVGLGVSEQAWVSGFRLLGLAVAGVVCLWLLVRSPSIGVVRAVGLAMVVTMLLGPVVWPWYLPAGLALLAASGLGRWRPTYLVLVMAASTFVWPTSVDPVQSISGVGHILGLAFLCLIAAVAFLAQHLSVTMGAWRDQRMARRQLTVAAHSRWMTD